MAMGLLGLMIDDLVMTEDLVVVGLAGMVVRVDMHGLTIIVGLMTLTLHVRRASDAVIRRQLATC